jgi:hypothetical protein
MRWIPNEVRLVVDGLKRELEQERQDRKQAEADICRALGERNDARAELAAERALADRLSSELSACKNTFGIEFGGTTEALAAWKEARRA